MKNFIANIPVYFTLPIRLIGKLCSITVGISYLFSGRLHKTFKTKLGLKIIAAERQAKEMDKTFQEIQKLAKKVAESKGESDPTLAKHIGNGGNNGPTFH